jgi:hypothetical protein
MILYSCAQSQVIQRINEKGYEASIGMHNFVSKRNGSKISNLAPTARGIALGYFFGNSIFKMRLKGIGYYGSTGFVTEKFHQYEAEGLINIYPLEFVRTRRNVIDVYMVTGINHTHIGMEKDGPGISRQIDRTTHVLGIGFECLMRRGCKIMRFFSELNFGNSFCAPDKREEMKRPVPATSSAVNFGVRMSCRKMVKVRPASW